MAGVAAQSRRLAREISNHSVALCRDRAPACRARTGAPDCAGRQRGEPRQGHPASGGRRPRAGHLSSVADGSRMDARFRPDFCAQSRSKGGDHQLAVQRLGEVRRLASRRSTSRASGRSAGSSAMAAFRCASRWFRAPSRARRRVDRHQRRGHSADHGRMPAQRSPAAQPRGKPRCSWNRRFTISWASSR